MTVSPAALDTLNELAAALGDDANFATTVTNMLALKAPLASPVFTGNPRGPTPAAAADDTRFANTQWVRARFADLNTAIAPPDGLFYWPYPATSAIITLIGGGGGGGDGSSGTTDGTSGTASEDSSVTVLGTTYTAERGGGGGRGLSRNNGSDGGGGGVGGSGGVGGIEHIDGVGGTDGEDGDGGSGEANAGVGGGSTDRTGSGGDGSRGTNGAGAGGGGGQGGTGKWRVDGLELGTPFEIVTGDGGRGGGDASDGIRGLVILSPETS